MIRGGDMALAMLGKIDMDVSSDWAKNDPTNIYCLREAAKNILYVVAQSNVMNHVTTMRTTRRLATISAATCPATMWMRTN